MPLVSIESDARRSGAGAGPRRARRGGQPLGARRARQTSRRETCNERSLLPGSCAGWPSRGARRGARRRGGVLGCVRVRRASTLGRTGRSRLLLPSRQDRRPACAPAPTPRLDRAAGRRRLPLVARGDRRAARAAAARLARGAESRAPLSLLRQLDFAYGAGLRPRARAVDRSRVDTSSALASSLSFGVLAARLTRVLRRRPACAARSRRSTIVGVVAGARRHRPEAALRRQDLRLLDSRSSAPARSGRSSTGTTSPAGC